MQFVGNALQRTDRSIRQRMDIVQYLYLRRSQHGGLFRLAHLRIVQHIQIAGHITGEIVQVDLRTGGNGEGHQYPCYGWMNTRFQEQNPDKKTDNIIEQVIIYPHLPSGIQ